MRNKNNLYAIFLKNTYIGQSKIHTTRSYLYLNLLVSKNIFQNKNKTFTEKIQN